MQQVPLVLQVIKLSLLRLMSADFMALARNATLILLFAHWLACGWFLVGQLDGQASLV